jgi:hypothetical protein
VDKKGAAKAAAARPLLGELALLLVLVPALSGAAGLAFGAYALLHALGVL